MNYQELYEKKCQELAEANDQLFQVRQLNAVVIDLSNVSKILHNVEHWDYRLLLSKNSNDYLKSKLDSISQELSQAREQVKQLEEKNLKLNEQVTRLAGQLDLERACNGKPQVDPDKPIFGCMADRTECEPAWIVVAEENYVTFDHAGFDYSEIDRENAYEFSDVKIARFVARYLGGTVKKVKR